jgi:hypothetical protein
MAKQIVALKSIYNKKRYVLNSTKILIQRCVFRIWLLPCRFALLHHFALYIPLDGAWKQTAQRRLT